MKLLLVGPCAVGKSTVAMTLANRAKVPHLDFDAHGIVDMEKRKGKISPFSVSKLNLMDSLSTILSVASTDFVLDMGGDTVFRKNVDNNERLEQVLWIKNTYTPHIVVLTAAKDVLLRRFISTKNRVSDEFDEVWESWLDIAQPYWQQCGDTFIDTSLLSVDDVIGRIETSLNRSVE